MEILKQLIGYVGYALEVVGVAIIVAGAVAALSRYGYRHILSRGGKPFDEFRQWMGRAMIAGLEFLVAGDIIRTVVVDHTIEDVLGLGLIVVIRTVLVFTIHLEVEGHWPWHKSGQPDPGTRQN